MKIPSEITFETTETNWVCMIVFLCAHVRISISTYIYWLILQDMHGNHHHHHQRTDLGGIAYLPLGHLCHAPPLQNPKYASDVNMPSQTKWRNVGWKTSTIIQRLQTFLIFVTFFYVFNVFIFLERFFTSMHQSAPAPSTVVINVCPGAETWTLLAADMKTLHGGFLWGVSDRLDIHWWTHVSNAQVLQRSGLSAIGYHRRLCLVMLHAWILDRVPALYMILCVWWWI